MITEEISIKQQKLQLLKWKKICEGKTFIGKGGIILSHCITNERRETIKSRVVMKLLEHFLILTA